MLGNRPRFNVHTEYAEKKVLLLQREYYQISVDLETQAESQVTMSFLYELYH